jgi:anti-anti-sigma factor
LLHDNNTQLDDLQIKIIVSEDCALARICGRVDIDSSPLLFERLLAFLQSPHPTLMSIDLSEVIQIDSSGVATLIEVLRIARASKTEVRLQGLHDRLLHLFESTGILSLFNGSGSRVSQSDARLTDV